MTQHEVYWSYALSFALFWQVDSNAYVRSPTIKMRIVGEGIFVRS
ncbi:MAG: hypothetical protein ACMUJM_10280 [bacterium]